MHQTRIIFMGTPEFAVSSLQILVENQSFGDPTLGDPIEVVAVITAPDKPKGRGRKIAYSPVKQYALTQDIPVLQPTNLKNPDFLEELKSYEADLQVVVAFRMLPEVVWNMPTQGTFNLHASYLPQYRGAAPINWAIINGETETGVTTFMIRHEIDTGNILFQDKEPIYADDTAGTLYERLMKKGAKLVLRTVKAISQNNYALTPQEDISDLKPAPKIHRETCKIDWNQSAEQIRNFVRGLSPYPAAWTELTLAGGEKKNCKVFLLNHTDLAETDQAPGDFATDNKSYLHMRAQDGWLAIEELQLEGKRRMMIDEFLRGTAL
ncbi:methionyl-tRNA formyltransferase [Tunicatimonas pelagia]|uniref:methionyl-tRNA formyltransferase n=1 Tax=Tunicatimonas pelagia TaxID=931531 RepID=UPI002665BB73|nr:methionyl-tRNA formyltransferase [Tunicatimonas pelagia]WKN45861.1 methionyl-tRNA formyltransferase [Tunicatimonas pelagia]